MFLLPPGIRGEAVRALALPRGGRVLEVGCGTGRNVGLLEDAVGPDGRIFGVDLSPGMLARARAGCERAGWENVALLQADAAEYEPPEPVDGVLFSLSYAVLPEPRRVLRRAWAALRPGGRAVVMDAKIAPGFLGRVLRPFAVGASRATVLGDPDRHPWDDLGEIGASVEVREFLNGSYFVCSGTKPPSSPVRYPI